MSTECARISLNRGEVERVVGEFFTCDYTEPKRSETVPIKTLDSPSVLK